MPKKSPGDESAEPVAPSSPKKFVILWFVIPILLVIVIAILKR